MDLCKIAGQGSILQKHGLEDFWRVWPKLHSNFRPKRCQKCKILGFPDKNLSISLLISMKSGLFMTCFMMVHRHGLKIFRHCLKIFHHHQMIPAIVKLSSSSFKWSLQSLNYLPPLSKFVFISLACHHFC